MKRLIWLVCIVLAGVLLFHAGIVTPEKALDWTEKGLSWSIDRLSDLLDLVTAQSSSADSSIDPASVLLVNADHPLPDNYSPDELVRLYDEDRSFLLARDDLYLTRTVFDAANRMFAAANEQAGLTGYIITSAYRDRTAQEKIYNESEPGYAQKPGCSEHETGLAFDVTVRRDSGEFLDTPHCQWLLAHCHEYGFIQRYPEGREDVTGVQYEPWHYRYVGEALAQKIFESGCTLEEYLNK